MTSPPRALAVASSGAFVAALSTSLVAVSAPVIARDLRVTPGEASWVLSSYLLVVSCLLALAGRAADVLGPRRVYLAGFAFFVAGSGACAGAGSLALLVGARVVQGIGAAMLMATGPAIVTRVVSKERRGRALGLQVAATYVGLTAGPGVGGAIAALIGWHAVFVVIAGAGALGFAATWLLLDDERPPADRARPPLDLGGAALFAGALSALLLGLRRGPEHGWASARTLALFLVGAGALAVFARREARHAAPLLPLPLLRAPAFAFGVAGATLLYVVTLMLSFLLTFELQHGAGLSSTAAGAFMTAQPATMALVAPASGVLADRRGPRLPTTLGMLAIAAGLFGVAFTARAHGAPLVASLMVVGVGAGLYVAPNTAMIMASAARDRQGTAGAMAATARNLGMTLGVALAASLQHAVGFRAAVLVGVALAVVGALLGLVRPVVRSDA